MAAHSRQGTYLGTTLVGFTGFAAGLYAGGGLGIVVGIGGLLLLIISALVISAALFLVAPRVKRMMANPKANAPADRTEKKEPLPAARTVED